MLNSLDSTKFLAGGGEMGLRIREHNWTGTSLGPPKGWPAPLRTAIRLILNTGHPMYIWWGAELRCFYNDAYCRSIGPERHPGSLGQPGRQVWAEIWDIIGPQIEHVMAGRGATWNENHLVPITRNGKREDVYWTYSYSPIDDELSPGGVGGVLVVCSETTKQVVAEREKAAEHERLRRLFEQAPGFMAMLRGPEHVFELTNAAYTQLVGHRNVIGKPVRAALPEIEGQGFFELLDNVYETGKPYVGRAVPVDLQRTPGAPIERRFVDLVYQPITDALSGVSGIFAEGSDVTDRVIAESELRALNEQLEQRVVQQSSERNRVWEMSRDLLAVMGFDGHLKAINPAWETTLGQDRETLLSLSFRDQVHPDDHAAVQAMMARLLRGETVDRFEDRLRHADGSWRWISWTLVPEGEVFYAVGRDVTAEKQAAAELEQAQEALRQSQKMEAMGQLTGGVAHDFNNLLTPIVGSLDMLQRRGIGGEREQRLIAGAVQSADRARTLVQRLLAFARRQPLQPTAVDLGQLIAGMADLLASTTGPQIRVVVESAEGLPPAKADPNQMEMALLNLGVNARDAMPTGGTLRISASAEMVGLGSSKGLKPGLYVRLSVADTGQGMDEATLARAVEPFFSTKGIGKGTGLGLSMVHGLASQLGGGMTIQSRLGVGTNVELWLPAASAPVELADEKASVVRDAPLIGTALLVDDEELVRMSTADMLSDLGYKVVEATSGEEAMRLLNGGLEADLIVTDHLMPGMNGTDLARSVRAQRPNMQILVISGYAEAEGIAPDLARLTKPFRNADLALSLASLPSRERS